MKESQLQIGRDLWVKLQTSPRTFLNFRDAEKNLSLKMTY